MYKKLVLLIFIYSKFKLFMGEINLLDLKIRENLANKMSEKQQILMQSNQ